MTQKEKKRIVEEYNRRRSEIENSVQGTSEDEESSSIYDARNDVEWIIKRASNYGLHFLFCFDQGRILSISAWTKMHFAIKFSFHVKRRIYFNYGK